MFTYSVNLDQVVKVSDDCSCCLQPLAGQNRVVQILACKHILCCEDFQRNLNRKDHLGRHVDPDCPQCRKAIDLTQVRYLYSLNSNKKPEAEEDVFAEIILKEKEKATVIEKAYHYGKYYVVGTLTEVLRKVLFVAQHIIMTIGLIIGGCLFVAATLPLLPITIPLGIILANRQRVESPIKVMVVPGFVVAGAVLGLPALLLYGIKKILFVALDALKMEKPRFPDANGQIPKVDGKDRDFAKMDKEIPKAREKLDQAKLAAAIANAKRPFKE